MKGETKAIQEIEIESLDEYIANFVLSCKTKEGKDYEPSSIRNMLSSFDRELKQNKYPHLIMSSKGPEFSLTRDAFAAKSKSLKKKGKGNKPNAASPLTDDELDKLYEQKLLGDHSPESLLNTIWFNNCIHLGLRGTTEQYNLCWQDITLKTSADGTEFLELNERQTKTRTGDEITNVRKVAPRFFATGEDKCPVKMYKLYAEKRPSDMCVPGTPFYLASKTSLISDDSESPLFMKQRVGSKKLGGLLRLMAEKGGLSGKKLTNHSVRKRMVQKLRDENMPPTDIMQFTGHKNIQSVLNYSAISEQKQKAGSHILSGKHNQAPASPGNIRQGPGIRTPVTATITCPTSELQSSITTRPLTNSEHTNAQVNPTSTPSHVIPQVHSMQLDMSEVNVNTNYHGNDAAAHSQHPTHQQFMALSSSTNSFQSQFYGAVFNVQNFNVYSSK